LSELGYAALAGELRATSEFLAELPEKGGVNVNFSLDGAEGAQLLLRRK
jgi:hypothetical protein